MESRPRKSILGFDSCAARVSAISSVGQIPWSAPVLSCFGYGSQRFDSDLERV
jgi:hypothetical protein